MTYSQYPRLDSSFGKVPERVLPDMDNGLESGSCALAMAFYNLHKEEAVLIRDRHLLGKLFSNKQEELLLDMEIYKSCKVSGRQDPRRHWSQVLFALKNHVRVLRVVAGGSVVEWMVNPIQESSSFVTSLSDQMMLSRATTLDDFLKELDLVGLTEEQRVEMGCLLTRFYGGIESAEDNMLVDASFDEVRDFIAENRTDLEKGEIIAHQEMLESRHVIQHVVDAKDLLSKVEEKRSLDAGAHQVDGGGGGSFDLEGMISRVKSHHQQFRDDIEERFMNRRFGFQRHEE